MIKTPCEIVLWDFLPALRRELVKAMIKKGVKRKDVARTFGITESAVCLYLKHKRGSGFKFDKNTRKQIEESAMRIIESKNNNIIVFELCRLCSMLKKQKAFCSLHQKENPELIDCSLYKTIC